MWYNGVAMGESQITKTFENRAPRTFVRKGGAVRFSRISRGGGGNTALFAELL